MSPLMNAPARLSHLVCNDEGFIFDTTTGESYVANPAAIQILRGLQEGHEERDIVAELTQRFLVELDDARRDVAEFIGRLKLLQLI